MIRIVFIAIIGLLFVFKVEAKKIPGQIIYKNDTVNVILNIPTKILPSEPNYVKLQKKVKYFDSQGVKKVVHPGEAIEIRFVFKSEEVRMVSRPNRNLYSNKLNLFLKVEVDGDLKLFSYYYTVNSHNPSAQITMGQSYTARRFLLQKGDEDFKMPKKIGFKKDMMEYFDDCPELSKKIESKEFRKSEMVSMVIFYNRSCN